MGVTFPAVAHQRARPPVVSEPRMAPEAVSAAAGLALLWLLPVVGFVAALFLVS